MNSTTASATQYVLIGTAGHIDHGKTRLVSRLTGMDTDRLPEEKRRGISIDLGFANWHHGGFCFGVVDVPGHERFVRNMVAGATGVNIALLVVAADDGVMPQTREHLEIMDLLGISAGVIAITKIDLVDAEFVELVEAELAETVTGTFLESAPVVPVSSETGEGIDRLRDCLAETAAQIEIPPQRHYFRMPIDRVFSVTGHGTIVTGSAWCGEVHAGDVLELLPEQREVRVRSVENHGELTKDSAARRRTAVNLASVKVDEVQRGMELASPGHLLPTRRLVAELRVLGSSPMDIKNRQELNLYLGTGEAPARVIHKAGPLEPGQSGFVELRLKEPVVAEWGQRFVLRRPSPALTIAGGRILDPFVPPRKRLRNLDAYASGCASSSADQRLGDILVQEDVAPHNANSLSVRIGISPDFYQQRIQEWRTSGVLLPLGRKESPLLIHRDRLQAVSQSVMRTIRETIAAHQPRRSLPKSSLLAACRNIAGSEVLEAVFTKLLKSKELVRVGENLGPADAQVQLTRKQRALLEDCLRQITEADLAPPTVKELASAAGHSPDEILSLLNVSVEDGLLIPVSEALYFSPAAIEQARRSCAEFMESQGPATLSQLREVWGVSRKFAVPLGEFFDAHGVTSRDGDLRKPGPQISDPHYHVSHSQSESAGQP